ncbi:MAG TPA: FAD-dependent oxidoreductase [Gammaproteobacteria bacterium]|nr:FAD-dependent oxidoreductase [Gammaproteobacteria bacterium]
MTNTIETVVRRRGPDNAVSVDAEICVLGAGISGIAAAIEAARLGRRVVLADAAPALGGQAVGSIIGTIIGLFSHGSGAYQITHGLADELIAELTASGALLRRHSTRTGTITFQYDVVQMGRWVEQKVQDAGVQTLIGATLTAADFKQRRLQSLRFATRFGSVQVNANGYVDASGDAVLSWQAGLAVREPDAPVYGSLNFILEGYDEQRVAKIDHEQIYQRLRERGAEYGLVRHDGFLFAFPGKGTALANITHFQTPLDPLRAGDMVFEGRKQADAVVQFLRKEFPDMFANVQVRYYGNPGIRQTRWIVGQRQLTLDDIRAGQRPADAVARCAWWVELHDTEELVHWERFPDGHVYYIPLSCMVPQEADNIVAAGRCVDADTYALSAVRVMGPCIAMGAAAAHALDLAGDRPVTAVNMGELQRRLHDNLERTD